MINWAMGQRWRYILSSCVLSAAVEMLPPVSAGSQSIAAFPTGMAGLMAPQQPFAVLGASDPVFLMSNSSQSGGRGRKLGYLVIDAQLWLLF